MSDNQIYPDEITESELNAGFSLERIENPDGNFAFAAPCIKAVVFYPKQSYRVIKSVDLIEREICYRLQRYGKYNFTSALVGPEWLPANSLPDYDPVSAVRNAPRRIAEEEADSRIISHVPPPIIEGEDADIL